ncbi:MAG: hypothetical protein HY360_03580 [Verrucomicrobia bacterium]|nr:hypothetical protein [Verrucomicrobiota bacterium]
MVELTRLWQRISVRLAVSAMLAAMPTPFVFSVEISPSKYQGGATNNVPNQAQGAPSIFRSPFKWIFGSGHSEAMKRVNAPPNFKVDLTAEPQTFQPGAEAVLKARMTVVNQGKEKYILEFNTAQRYDFIVRRQDGSEVYRASANKAYSQQVSSTVVNRNEKLVYEEDLFAETNQTLNLPPGEYKLIGQITAQVPISVEATFQVSP